MICQRTPNVRKWSEAKLDKELAFAQGFADPKMPETITWLNTLLKEEERRGDRSNNGADK